MFSSHLPPPQRPFNRHAEPLCPPGGGPRVELQEYVLHLVCGGVRESDVGFGVWGLGFGVRGLGLRIAFLGTRFGFKGSVYKV